MIEPPGFESLLETAQKSLEENQEMDPILFFNSPPGNNGVMMPCIEMHPLQGIAVIEVAIKQGITNRPDWVALVTDSYHIHGDRDETEAATTYPGSLKELFEKGDPRVGEALVVNCVSRLGMVYYAQRPYARVDGKFIWEDIQDFSDADAGIGEFGGVVVEGMRALVNAPEHESGPDDIKFN